MRNLRDLYQQLVLDHGRNPRNRRPIHDCDGSCHHTEGYNPLCGDKLTLHARTEGDVIADLAFEGEGCAIFTASSSMLTEVLRGRKRSEIKEVVDEFIGMLTDGRAEPDPDGLGKLAVFGGVKDFPARVKCATLPWRALEAILEATSEAPEIPEAVTTEGRDEERAANS